MCKCSYTSTVDKVVIDTTYLIKFTNPNFFFAEQNMKIVRNKMYARRTRSFSVTRMRSSNSARMNKFDFITEKIGSIYMPVFEIVAHRNVDNWIQLLT